VVSNGGHWACHQIEERAIKSKIENNTIKSKKEMRERYGLSEEQWDKDREDVTRKRRNSGSDSER